MLCVLCGRYQTGCIMRQSIRRVSAVFAAFVVCCVLDLASQGGALAASPLECGMTQMGVRSHIECVVLRDSLQIRQVHLNSGECRTMQEHVELNPKEKDRLKRTLAYPLATLDYRRTYRAGQKFTVYLMPCQLRDYMIETDQGSWGWLAQRQ